jgi:hypothetical protein
MNGKEDHESHFACLSVAAGGLFARRDSYTFIDGASNHHGHDPRLIFGQ